MWHKCTDLWAKLSILVLCVFSISFHSLEAKQGRACRSIVAKLSKVDKREQALKKKLTAFISNEFSKEKNERIYESIKTHLKNDLGMSSLQIRKIKTWHRSIRKKAGKLGLQLSQAEITNRLSKATDIHQADIQAALNSRFIGRLGRKLAKPAGVMMIPIIGVGYIYVDGGLPEFNNAVDRGVEVASEQGAEVVDDVKAEAEAKASQLYDRLKEKLSREWSETRETLIK